MSKEKIVINHYLLTHTVALAETYVTLRECYKGAVVENVY